MARHRLSKGVLLSSSLLTLCLLGYFSPYSFSAGSPAEGEPRQGETPGEGGGRPRPERCRSCPDPSPQKIYAPTIALPDAPGSQIVLNCRSSKEMEVTPTFYTAEGEAVAGDTFLMRPAEIRFVEIKELIPAGHRGRRSWGGVSFSYTGNVFEMWAQIALRGPGGAGTTDVTFSVLDGRGSEVQEAVWWAPERAASVIALGNSSASPIRTSVRYSDGESRDVSIAPFATEYVRKERGDRNSPAGGVAEGVRLTTEGPAGSLRAVGVVASGNGRFASSIRFYDPQAAVQPHLFATNLRLRGAAPRMVLKNTGDAELSAQPRFRPAGGEGDAVVELPALTLRPGEVADVDLRPLAEAAARRADLASVSVQVVNSGAPGSLVGALYSPGAGVGYDVPLRDSGRARNLTGSYPWRIDRDYTTVVTITNVGDQPASFLVDVRYGGGGSYFLAPRELAVGETATFDLREMLAGRRPDDNGKQFPAGLRAGQFHWSVTATPGTPRLIGRAEVVSASERVSSSYSCPICCPDNGPYGGFTGSSQLFVDGFAARNTSGDYIDCYSNVVATSSIPMTSIWTWQTSVATNNPFSGGSTTLHGEAAGSTTLSGDYYVTEYDDDGMDCYNYSHPAQDDMPVQVQCTKPTGETTASGGWASSQGLGTVHKWNQTLAPASPGFSGRSVTEQGFGVNIDTCHFTGSAFPKAQLSGGTWPVNSSNVWGPDYIGYTPTAVAYYRQSGRAPCGSIIGQRMLINCSTGALSYKEHNIGADINTTTVRSYRNGQSVLRSW